jgi:hypothetical protein
VSNQPPPPPGWYPDQSGNPLRDVSGGPRRGPGPVVASHKRIVLRNTQARAELPAGSRRTIAASRIEPHRAGAVALQAVEHTDPNAVVGGPVRGCAAGYPHARLQVVGELSVAGAFVADPRRLDCLCCDGGCRGHLGCSDPLFGRQLRAAAAPQGRGEVEPVRVAAGAYHGPLGQVDQEGPATG